MIVFLLQMRKWPRGLGVADQGLGAGTGSVWPQISILCCGVGVPEAVQRPGQTSQDTEPVTTLGSWLLILRAIDLGSLGRGPVSSRSSVMSMDLALPASCSVSPASSTLPSKMHAHFRISKSSCLPSLLVFELSGSVAHSLLVPKSGLIVTQPLQPSQSLLICLCFCASVFFFFF